MKKIFPMILAIFVWSGLSAQKKDSLWTSPSMKSEIQWMVLASDGTLITSNLETLPKATKGTDVYTILSGIDPQSGIIKWKYPATPPSTTQVISGIEFIPNTPYFKLKNGPLTIIDPYDGHVIVDVTAAGITQEEGYGYLLQSGHLWVSGTYNGDRCISLFELGTGKKLWSNSELLKENNKVASKLSKFSALTGSALPNKKPIKLLGSPINHGTDKMIVATSNGIFDVQLASGQTGWKADLPDPNKGKMIKVEVDIDFMKLIPGPDKFYVVKAAYMTACSYDDGKQVWANPVKTSGPIGQIIYDEKGLILCPESSNVKGMVATGLLKMVNGKTGEELWSEGLKFPGGVIQTYVYTDKGLAVVMANPATDKNAINFIDVAAGKFVLPKNVNLAGEAQYLELTPKGLLYKTDRTVNILGLESDQSLLPFPAQSKRERPILSANAGDRYYFYSDADQNVYEINKSAGTGKQLNKAKIEFQGGESPEFIDVRREGIALYSKQNITLITYDGTAKFNAYNPGVQTLKTIVANVNNALEMMNAVVAVAAMGTNIAGALAGGSSGQNQFDQANQAFAAVGNANYLLNLKQFGSIKNRLKASGQSQDFVVMMTRVDGRPTLVAVNKDTGVVGSKILLARRDNEPMFVVDSGSDMLYYAPKGKNLIGWGTSDNAVSGFAMTSH
ncbi:MAG TPA: PQQ-binding-like beta-propeller repeat protein [Cyclobacteriaceae bacterium]|nr:PQQ-binding-like beta-propeller repeat protein [Cyclobacteriaceae bacterium]